MPAKSPTHSGEHLARLCNSALYKHPHLSGTWEDNEDVGSKGEGGASSKRKTFRSFFEAKPAISTTDDKKSEESSASRKLFWPKDYLTQDIPQARVWTYGYNADVIGGLFQANNKNSVSQHGRDLAVRVEREIGNGVALHFSTLVRTVKLTTILGPDLVPHSLGGIIVKDVGFWFSFEFIKNALLIWSFRLCTNLRHVSRERD